MFQYYYVLIYISMPFSISFFYQYLNTNEKYGNTTARRCSNLKNICKVISFTIFIFLFSLLALHTKEKISPIAELQSQLLRFHVIANSDNPIDQQQKLEVKNTILQTLSPFLSNCSSKEEAKQIIQSHMSDILTTTHNTLRSNDQTVTAEIETCYFPTKTYGDLTFPPGQYESLSIRIGEAKGQNWWCVMYPPLCFVDASYGTVPEQSKQKLQGLLSHDTYETITQKDQPLKIGFRFLPFLEKLWNRLSSDSVE